jgi:hypothetical protein
LVVGAALLAAPVATANQGTHYYVSLGDSLAVGVQPNGPPPLNETDQGYTDQWRGEVYALGWSVYRDSLTFSRVPGSEPLQAITAKSWRRLR